MCATPVVRMSPLLSSLRLRLEMRTQLLLSALLTAASCYQPSQHFYSACSHDEVDMT